MEIKGEKMDLFKKVMQSIFSVKNTPDCHKKITVFGVKMKIASAKKMAIKTQKQLDHRNLLTHRREVIDNNLFCNLYLKLNYLENKDRKFNPEELFDKKIRPLNNCYLDSNISYINYLFSNLEGTFDNNQPREKFPNFFYTCGIAGRNNHTVAISEAMKTGNHCKAGNLGSEHKSPFRLPHRP